MSGHSKWATIKHKKGALDAKRGKIFTRLLKEIAVAAKGGGNPDTNARLRTAVAAAKAENMPQDNIKRAIQRGTGELEGVNYEEITFEGYGPGGVAIIVDVTTDNRNRAVSEIRHAFSKNGGNLGESGSVRFMFSKKGLIAVEKSAATEDQLMDIVLEHGGEDLNDEGDAWEIITEPASYEAVAAAIKAAGIPTVMSEVTMVASTYTKLEGNAANQMIRLLKRWKIATIPRTFTRTLTWMPNRWNMLPAEPFGSWRSKKAARLWRSFFGDSRVLIERREAR